MSAGWRYTQANRYFLGTKFFKSANITQQPTRLWHILDVTGTYQVNRRLNVAVTLPVALNKASFLAPGNGSVPEFRQTIHAHSVGDVLIMGRSWLFKPDSHPKGNVLLGVGVKLPTGNFHEQGVYSDFTGSPLRRQSKPIPVTIMPGDGGVDVTVEALAFKVVNFPLRKSTVFAYANYLVTPFNTNGVKSQVFTSLNPAFVFNPAVVQQNANVNSVPDGYAIRAGYVFSIPKVKKESWLNDFRFLLAYRWEGVPVHDFIGGSKGFRQPGYFMAVEPGLFYQHKRHLLQISSPISFLRCAKFDIAQMRGSPDPLTTAFTPASLNLRYTYLF